MENSFIESKLLFAQNALTNASSHEEIKTAIAEYQYDDVRMQEGKTLHQTASTLQVKQVKEYGEQYEATRALNVARAEANKTYVAQVAIARVALKNDHGLAASLLLGGRRKESISGWLNQAKTFYANSLASDAALAALGKYGITNEKLEAGQALVKEVEAKYNIKLKETGEAQDATEARDKAFDELQEWMSDFLVIARIALTSNPQYLEILGISQPS